MIIVCLIKLIIYYTRCNIRRYFFSFGTAPLNWRYFRQYVPSLVDKLYVIVISFSFGPESKACFTTPLFHCGADEPLAGWTYNDVIQWCNIQVGNRKFKITQWIVNRSSLKLIAVSVSPSSKAINGVYSHFSMLYSNYLYDIAMSSSRNIYKCELVIRY